MAANNARVEQLDTLWLNIVTELLHKAVAEATTCTETIFNMASLYLRREAFEALAKFYELYFDHNHDSKKNAVNAEVDVIFAAAVANIEQHGDHGAIEVDIREDQQAKRVRLAMAALQKQLEGLIVLDVGIRDEIIPALSSMQFEDALRQRLEHLATGWKLLIDRQSQIALEGSAVAVARELATVMSSVEETEIYFRHVLGEEVPVGVSNGNAAGSILLF